jgi:hypothetical protein
VRAGPCGQTGAASSGQQQLRGSIDDAARVAVRASRPPHPHPPAAHLHHHGGGSSGVPWFFASFYAALFEGHGVLDAIAAGEAVAPGTDFVCYHL